MDVNGTLIKQEVTEECIMMDISIEEETTEVCTTIDINTVNTKSEKNSDELPEDTELLDIPVTGNIQELDNFIEDISEINSMLDSPSPDTKNVEDLPSLHEDVFQSCKNEYSTDNLSKENVTDEMPSPNKDQVIHDIISTSGDGTFSSVNQHVNDEIIPPVEGTVANNLEKCSNSNTSNQLNKEDKETQTLEEYEVIDKVDHSLLQPPLNLGVKNVKQILSCVQSGSVEVQDIIFNECNIIYECKVCHNLFRCLANLLSHKRFYCKDSYCTIYEQYIKKKTDVTMVIEPESPPEIYNEESTDIPTTPEIQDNSEPPSLAEIQISTPKIFTPNQEKKRSFTREPEEDSQDETFIHLEHIKSNPNAVFQTVIETCDKMDDSMGTGSEKEDEANADKNHEIMAKKKIVLGREKKLMKRSDCDIKKLLCLKCNTKYETLKGLYMHMITIHATKRVCYPCIYCKTSFASLYGVGRHMMKIHNKTKEHVSRIRDLVKRRAYVSKGPLPALDAAVNQEPRTETVPPPIMHACSKCNRMFDRKSSQISHQKFCRVGLQQSSPTPQQVREKKKEPEARGPSLHRCTKCSRSFKLKSSQISHTKFCKGSSVPKTVSTVKSKAPKVTKALAPKTVSIILQEDTCRPKRDVKKKKIGNEFVCSQALKWRSANKVEAVSGPKVSISTAKEQVTSTAKEQVTSEKLAAVVKLENVSAVQEKSTSSLKSAGAVHTSLSPPRRSHTQPSHVKMPSPMQMKTTHTSSAKSVSVNVIEGRVSSIINAQKLYCLKCNRKFSTFSNLRRHAATHIGWMRFRCKHCNYKCFNRSDCRSHILRMHPGSYTSIENIDKNIIKLATGKLLVRRDDFLPNSGKKGHSKANKPEEVKENSTSQTIQAKPAKIAKEPPSPKSTEIKQAKPLKERPSFKVVELNPPKPVTSVVLKTSPQEPSLPQAIPKASPHKIKEVIKLLPPKPVTSLVLRAVPSEPVILPKPPILMVKSSARKSTGGANPKILKRVLIPPSAQPLPKPKQSQPESSVATPQTANQPTSPLTTPKKKLSPSTSNLNSPPKVKSKGNECTLATTKPHVIVLNARTGLINTPTSIVTRGTTFTKPILTLKVPIKSPMKQNNGQTLGDPRQKTTTNEIPDHQYT